jgi:hypothetical protein
LVGFTIDRAACRFYEEEEEEEKEKKISSRAEFY